MSRYGVTPNLLVMPPQMLLYMALAPEAKLTYKEGGPAAEARFEAGVAGFEARSFRGCGVVTSEPFEVSDDQDSVQMLTRSTQIGEFYIMSPPQVQPTDGKHTCDLLIYDEESDRHVRITWGQALSQSADAWLNYAKGWSQFNGDPEYASFSFTAPTGAGAPSSSDPMYKKLAYGGGLDVRIVVARPFIEHMMHSAVLAVSGRDTGATLFGPADMQLSANTQVKTIEGHYTGHFKSVVTKPQNVFVMRDVACADYVAGCNTTWFAKENNKFSASAAQRNIQDRLSFSDDVGARYRSMLAFPMWEGQETSGGLDTVMSITTRLLPWEVTGVGSGTHLSFPGGEEMYNLYRDALGLDSVHFGEDMKAAQQQEFISQGSTNNATCFLGPHRKYDPFTKSFMGLIPGQGHFGPDAIPGDARWRRGESVSLKAARDTMVPLELAQHAQMVYQPK